MFPTLARTLTPNDPRWVCTYRLAPRFWPEAVHPDIAVLLSRLGLDEPPADPDFRHYGFHAACAAVLLGHVCRALPPPFGHPSARIHRKRAGRRLSAHCTAVSPPMSLQDVFRPPKAPSV